MPALQEIEIKNFKCLSHVQIQFSDVTAFVGPNASGKSALMEAIVRQPGPFGSAARNRDQTLPQALYKRVEATWYGWASFHGRTVAKQKPPKFAPSVYQLDLRLMRQPALVRGLTSVNGNGSELVNVFETLTREQQKALADKLCELVPVYSDLDTVPVANGQKEFRFHDRWSPNTFFRPEEVSDGTIFVLALLLIAAAPDTPPLVCIEEPERGLHPYLIDQVVGLLRGLARGELGKRAIQVVLATQSAELLNYLQPDEVRFMERDADGGTVVSVPPTEDKAWEAAFQAYENSLRNAWLAGALGAVPGR